MQFLFIAISRLKNDGRHFLFWLLRKQLMRFMGLRLRCRVLRTIMYFRAVYIS